MSSNVYAESNSEVPIDPSTLMLLNSTLPTANSSSNLNSSSNPNNTDSGIETGRYTIRKKDSKKPVNTDSETGSNYNSNSVLAPTSDPNLNPDLNKKQNSPQNSKDSATKLPKIEKQTQASSTKTLPLGPLDSKTVIELQRENALALQIAPFWLYNDSHSDSTYRQYVSSSTGIKFDLEFWAPEQVAIHTQFATSMGANVNDALDNSKQVKLTQQWYQIGLRSRKYKKCAQSSSFTFGLDYSDYQFQVDSSSSIRSKLATSGFNLSVQSQVPHSNHYASEFGLSFLPYAKHQELQTDSGVHSGDLQQTHIFGFHFGGRFFYDSIHQLYWKLSQQLERDQFKSTSTKAEPNGVYQSNVGVSNSFTMFELGYSFGD